MADRKDGFKAMLDRGRITRYAVVASVMLVVWGASTRQARAGHFGPQSWSFTLGGSVGGFVHDDFSAFSMTIEGTVAYPIAESYLYIWMSGGLRTALSTQHQVLFPYVEMGVWFFFNIGIGYAAGLNDRQIAPHNVNLFVGLPIPLPQIDKGPLVLEPYYRFGGGHGKGALQTSHEFGLMIKWWHYLGGR